MLSAMTLDHKEEMNVKDKVISFLFFPGMLEGQDYQHRGTLNVN